MGHKTHEFLPFIVLAALGFQFSATTRAFFVESQKVNAKRNLGFETKNLSADAWDERNNVDRVFLGEIINSQASDLCLRMLALPRENSVFDASALYVRVTFRGRKSESRVTANSN
jgi:hypothetical protein